VIAGIFSGLLNSALNGIAGSFAQAANSFLAVLFRLLNSSTSLSLSGASFLTEFNAVFMIGLLVALALAMIELGAAALQRNGARVAKVPLNLVLMIVGTVASISLIDMLLTISDQLSTGLLQATGFSLSTTGMSSALAVVASQPGTELMLSIFIIIAVICCYFALVVRRVLIVVAAVMAPLALAGATAQVTRSWVKRWSETILALIFSKVILVIVLITGFHLLQGAGATNIASAMASLIGGVAFSPLMAMKMVTFTGGHFAEAALVGHQAVSAAAAPVKKAAHVGTAAASGGVSGAAEAALGVRLPPATSRTSAHGGATPLASSRSPRTPSAPSPVSESGTADVGAVAAAAAVMWASSRGHGAPAPSSSIPTAASTTSATPAHSPSAPSRTSAERSTTQPASTSSGASVAGPVGGGAPIDANGGAVGPAPVPSASASPTSAALAVRPGTVDVLAAATLPAAAGDSPSIAARPVSPGELPLAPRADIERPSPPTPRPRPSAPAPYERPAPPPIAEAL
jgi:type IV secretion system protein TrbL